MTTTMGGQDMDDGHGVSLAVESVLRLERRGSEDIQRCEAGERKVVIAGKQELKRRRNSLGTMPNLDRVLAKQAERRQDVKGGQGLKDTADRSDEVMT